MSKMHPIYLLPQKLLHWTEDGVIGSPVARYISGIKTEDSIATSWLTSCNHPVMRSQNSLWQIKVKPRCQQLITNHCMISTKGGFTNTVTCTLGNWNWIASHSYLRHIWSILKLLFIQIKPLLLKWKNSQSKWGPFCTNWFCTMIRSNL